MDCTLSQANNIGGSIIYTAKGAPPSTLGKSGDIFISETLPYFWYKKRNSSWISIGQLAFPTSNSVIIEVTVSATDVSNGYINVSSISLSSLTTKVMRAGAMQDKSTYQLNIPIIGRITFLSDLSEGEVIQIFN